VDRAVAEGHWIGNHTFNHATSLGDSTDPGILDNEIGATQDLLSGVSHPDRLFRPRGAGGNLDLHLLSTSAVRYLQDGAYTLVLWSSVPRDWANPDGWEAACRKDIAAQDWSVVVLHDLPTGAMRHLSGVISRMLDSGLEIVQDFPDTCVPLRRGHLNGPIDHLVSAA
jgi:peptidoglycan-N-acetylglucosamine deacetylase